MNRKLWVVLLLVVIGFAGFIWVKNNNDLNESGSVSGTGAAITHQIGKPDAAVTLVEYSDFQCSACAAYYPIVESIIEEYKDRIRFEYKHYPLATIHRNAFAAARASEAAGKQNRFWEMYRLLFTNQTAWADSGNPHALFENYATQLGLDIPTYTTDFASYNTTGAINASIREFNQLGLQKATPTFLLNGKNIQPRNAEDFSKLIDEQLKQSS